MTPNAIMIFAAGLGTRMGALTETRPKPLISVGGRALIDQALALSAAITPLRRVVNTHYMAGMVKAHLSGQDVQFSDEPDLLLETGGGLRQALPLLGPGPVFTLNSDAVWRGPNPLVALAQSWDPARMEALLLLLEPENALGHSGPGDFQLAPNGQMTRGPGLIYAGAQILRTETLAAVPDAVFSLNRIWDQMAARGGLFGLRYTGKWCDVGRPESMPLAESMLKAADVS